MDNVIKVLEKRGLVEASTSPELEKIVEKPMKLYCGFDPTSDSLHLGNLVGIVVLEWFRRCGHQPVAIVGGATGMIGDPSGKSAERNLLSLDQLQHNVGCLRNLLNGLLNKDGSGALPVLNNYDWFSNFLFLDFLRDVGKHFRLGVMLSKEMVRTRLDSEEGMSFTEFSYQLLQGYDFYHLFKNEKVSLQIGGSDQWGNITAGTDLIRKLTGEQAYGLTFPLLTKSDGTKFGKTEKGAIWLSSEKLTSYDFFQHLYRVSDEDVVKLLRMLTFLPMEEIQALEKQLKSGDCEPNKLQRRLAEEVTCFVHDKNGLQMALELTAGLAPGKETVLTADILEKISEELPTHEFTFSQIDGGKLVDCLVEAKLFISKGDAKRMIRNGGVYLNNEKINDENYVLSHQDLIDGRFLLIAAGKKNKIVARISS